jgi:hypothetical protein
MSVPRRLNVCLTDRCSRHSNPPLHLPLQFIRILERIEMWMKERHPNEVAVIVPDTIHEGININLCEKNAERLSRSAGGQRQTELPKRTPSVLYLAA